MAALKPIFEARNISKSFGPVNALQDVSVSLYPGEVHAIIGENGAGKSTLMNIICASFWWMEQKYSSIGPKTRKPAASLSPRRKSIWFRT